VNEASELSMGGACERASEAYGDRVRFAIASGSGQPRRRFLAQARASARARARLSSFPRNTRRSASAPAYFLLGLPFSSPLAQVRGVERSRGLEPSR
jgi:hypothetical protein